MTRDTDTAATALRSAAAVLSRRAHPRVAALVRLSRGYALAALGRLADESPTDVLTDVRYYVITTADEAARYVGIFQSDAVRKQFLDASTALDNAMQDIALTR